MTVTLIVAQSLDGYITRHGQAGSEFTSIADKQRFRSDLKGFDCRVMGATTYHTTRDGTRRSAQGGRVHVILTRRPEAFVEDAIPGTLDFTRENPVSLVQSLAARGLSRCALLGGSQVYGAFLKAGVVDEIWTTIEPVLFGGGTRLLTEATECRLRLYSDEKLAPDTLQLKYHVQRS